MATILLSKFDAAERQLHTAINLFFTGSDPVSIHTLAEASLQILYDIRTPFNAKSFARDNNLIREDQKKEWLKALVASRNFFKHADRDSSALHEFDDINNHLSIYDASNLYSTIKGAKAPETWIFETWFSLKYADFLMDGEYKERALKALRDAPSLASGDFGPYRRQLLSIRSGELSIKGVMLEMGLSR